MAASKEWQEKLDFLAKRKINLYPGYSHSTGIDLEEEVKEQLTNCVVNLANSIMMLKHINGVLDIINPYPEEVREAILARLAKWARKEVKPGSLVMSSIREGDDMKDYWEIFDYLDGFYDLRVRTSSSLFELYVAREDE